MALLNRFANQQGSVTPISGGAGWFPGNTQNLEVKVVGLEVSEDARQYYATGKYVEGVAVKFEFELMQPTADSPDPNVPQRFTTNRVENYKLMVLEDFPAEVRDKMRPSVEINAATVAKMLNTILGREPTEAMTFESIAAAIDHVQSQLNEGAAPVISVTTTEKQDGKYTNRNVYVNGLLDNPIT
jgi:hypothetical protein